MKKVVCAQCGLVNLDKFVSFPHCAACGALLPRQIPSKWRRIWRRPVRPLYWMLAVGSGLGMLGLAIASIARETHATDDKPLLAYSQIPRDVTLGQTVTAQFTLDSALKNPDNIFENVSLRLNRVTQRQFVIVQVQPTPNLTESRGLGLYYGWDELPRGTVIKVSLRPRAAAFDEADGLLQLRATLWAAQYQPFEVRATIETVTKSGAPIVASATTAPIQKPSKVAR